VILEINKDFNVIFIQELLWLFICSVLSSSSKEEDNIMDALNHHDWITFSRTSLNNNNYLSIISYINIQLSHLCFSLCKDIFNHKDICCFSFFSNSDIYYIINIHSDANQSDLKYLKDIKVNVHNVLVMASNFNIRDSIWNPSISFYLIHGNLLVNVANSFDLLLLQSTNQVSTRYSDNTNDTNSVIDLMFLRPNSLEFDNYTIHPELEYLFDHAPLTVDIPIIKKFVPDKQYMIIKNSEEKDKFIFELIETIKKVNTGHLIYKDLFELIVQEFENKSDFIWYKHLSKLQNIQTNQ